MKKKVALLGATGSIGRSALDVLRDKSDQFEPVLLTANKNSGELTKLKKEFPKALTILTNDDHEELLKAIETAGADISINGISGAAGLESSLAVIRAGSDLALANKESVVMAGELLFSLAREKNVSVIPIDSEHMALYKLINAHGRENTKEIILTASGGPFRNLSKEELKNVSPKDALAHPTWNMGQKITIDSASLANKGLEVIEAARYFDFPPEKIKVVIHPQSIVHSMIRLHDGAVYAQMSKPDMRLAIHEALTWPKTVHSPFGILDFDSLHLSFEKPDMEKFPMLRLAYDALNGNAFLPAAYNAANEIAVQAFFENRISFLDISRIVGYVLKETLSWDAGVLSLEAVLKQDKKARELAEEIICNNRGKKC